MAEKTVKDHLLSHVDSPLQLLTPRVRILSAGLVSVATALVENPFTAGLFLLFSMVLAGASQIPVRDIWKRLSPVVWFLVMIWLFLPLTFGGESLYEWNFMGIPIELSRPGILLSLNISLKSMAILLIFTCLIATLPIQALGNGLEQLRVPGKLIFLLLMSYRYIYVIREEYERLMRAARFRGFRPGTNLHSYKTYAYLTGMLFVRASLRAKRVHQAMQCRGFTGRFHALDIYPSHWLNPCFLTLAAACGLGLSVLDLIWL